MKILRIQVRKWTHRFDRRHQRERLLLFFGVLGGLLVITVFGIHKPLTSATADIEKEALIKKGTAIQLKNQLEQLEAERIADPDAPKRKRLAELEHKLKQAEREIEALAGNIISPDQMTRFFKQLLAQNPSIHILSVENRPPVPLSEEGDIASPLLKYEVMLQLQGGYRDLVRYLKNLEALPWKVFWSTAELVTHEDAPPTLILEIYTLSFTKA